MNKYKRIRLTKATQHLETGAEIVEEVREDEESSYENLPEGIRDSELGEKLQENVDVLSDAYDSINDVIDNINGIL